jgi:hypothetical protein
MFTFAATVLGKYVMLATWHILKRCHMYVVWHIVWKYISEKRACKLLQQLWGTPLWLPRFNMFYLITRMRRGNL